MYEYRCKILKVVDGDTVDVDIDLGFGVVLSDERVRIMGIANLPALLPTDASSLYARNLLDFLKLIINDENKLYIPEDDDIVSATLVVNEGKIWENGN